MDLDSERLRSAADQLPFSQSSPVAKNHSSTFVIQPPTVFSNSPGGSGSKPMDSSSVAYSPSNYHAQQIQALSTMLAKQKQVVSQPPLETKVRVHVDL